MINANPTLIPNTPINLIKTKQRVKTNTNFLYDFLISGFAAAIAKTIIAPVERIKLLLQNQFIIKSSHSKYNGILHCAKEIISKEGFTALWRGNIVNIARYVPAQAFNFAFKDYFKTLFPKYDQNKQFWKFFFANCLSGGLATSISLFILYPIDFARTRLATDNLLISGERHFNGAIDCIFKIYRLEGVKGLYRGYVVASIGLSSYRAIYFGAYDSMKGNLIIDDTTIKEKFILAQLVTTVTAFIFYPFDTIRRRVMLQSGRENKIYSGTIDCAKTMLQQEGWKAYHKGFSAQILRSIGGASILVFYDVIQDYFNLEKRI